MFEPGEKVVCVCDTITDPNLTDFVERFYTDWVEEGQVYTVREVDLGRDQPIDGPTNKTVYKVLLVELKNPIDHRTADSANPSEFGFSSERFVALTQIEEQKVIEKSIEEPSRRSSLAFQTNNKY